MISISSAWIVETYYQWQENPITISVQSNFNDNLFNFFYHFNHTSLSSKGSQKWIKFEHSNVFGVGQ